MSQRVRRPRCDSWIITAAPASWQSSVNRFIHGTTSSFQTRRLENTGGLSRLTLADPAVITIATPAFARSKWYSR